MEPEVCVVSSSGWAWTKTMVVTASSCRPPPTPPEVDRIVDVAAVRLAGDDLAGHRGRQLDPKHPREVGRGVEGPGDVERPAGPAVAAPEPFHRLWVVPRQPAPEPRPERRAGRVVVDDEGDATRPQHPVQLGEARLAAGPEEVRPAR